MKKFDSQVINRVAVAKEMSLGNAEKDYVLSTALSKLDEFGGLKNFGFKGGTCLKKAYFPDFRFSSDLDFSVKTSSEDLPAFVRENFENKVLEGVKFKKIIQIDRTSGNTVLSIKYESQISDRKHVDSILLELSSDSSIILPLRERTVLNPLEFNLPKTTVNCLDLKEILAEKIHAIYHRPKPRDVYDLDFLLEKRITPDYTLIEAKLEPLSIKLEKNTFESRLQHHKQRWKRDLSQVLSILPNFEEIQARLLQHLFQNIN